VAFIEFSFYGERNIIKELLISKDSKRKPGKIGQEGACCFGMTTPKNPFWPRLGETS
jgi:hypothetical protein